MRLAVFLPKRKAQGSGFAVTNRLFKFEKSHMRFACGRAGQRPTFSAHFIFSVDGVANVVVFLAEIRFRLRQFDRYGSVGAFPCFDPQFSED